MFKYFKENFYLKAFAFTKVPHLFHAGPQIVALEKNSVTIRFPYQRRNLNHLGSMYFGTLCMGADAAGGILAQRLLDEIPKSKGKGSLIFKDFQAKFLKRAMGPTEFVCSDGEKIRDLVARAVESHERVECPVIVKAYVPQLESDPVAEFILTLSIKVKSS